MFERNGIMYVSGETSGQRVSDVRYLTYGMLFLTFSTGEERLFDVTTLSGPAYAPLEEEKVRRTVDVWHGAVIWLDGEIDCAPEYLYEHSYEYNKSELIS